MIGKRNKQPALFDVGNVFDLELDPSSFYAQLAQAGPQVFPEDAFADLYSATHGRPSVPPALMALLLLLQTYEGCADQAAIDRSAYDLRWAAVLRRPAGSPLCARTTLVLFRARLALHDATERLFDRALQHAQAQGLLPAGALRVLLDTKPVLGRGAVEDTYNLLARALDRLVRALAAAAGQPVADWAAARDLEAYVRRRDASLKGQAEVDWSDTQARNRLLAAVVAVARQLLQEAATVLPSLPEPTQAALQAEVVLLQSILAQDVRETPPAGPIGRSGGSGGSGDRPQAALRDGTAADRVPSVTDPEQRHGRKSAHRTFTGHKARVAVEPTSQLIVDVAVLAGNAGDAAGALQQVAAVEARTGQPVAETVGDCAFGSGATRQEFAEAERVLRARVPGSPATGQLPKARFTLLFTGTAVTEVRCPQGRSTTAWRDRKGGGRVFTFGDCCRRCPLRYVCVQRPGQSRTLQIHPQEHLLQQAREYQQSAAGQRTFRERVTVEHTLARLARLGVGQARYFGRRKTRAQLLLAATVVNLRRTWNWVAGGDLAWRRVFRAAARRLGCGVRSWWHGVPGRTKATRRVAAPPAWRGPTSAPPFCHHF